MHLFTSARARKSVVGLSATLALVALSLGIPTSFAAELTSAASPITLSNEQLRSQSTNSIIMRDGGICDPIRHMGC